MGGAGEMATANLILGRKTEPLGTAAVLAHSLYLAIFESLLPPCTPTKVTTVMTNSKRRVLSDFVFL